MYIVCDTYPQSSIKGGERQIQGEGRRYILVRPDMKIPSDFEAFLRNGENKESLFNLIERSIIESKGDLQERTIFFSNKAQCSKTTSHDVTIVDELQSDHEEADTKLVALVKTANLPRDKSVLIRSPSGDIDILVLFVAYQFDGIKMLIDNGTGKERSMIFHRVVSPFSGKRHSLACTHLLAMTTYHGFFV